MSRENCRMVIFEDAFSSIVNGQWVRVKGPKLNEDIDNNEDVSDDNGTSDDDGAVSDNESCDDNDDIEDVTNSKQARESSFDGERKAIQHWRKHLDPTKTTVKKLSFYAV